MLDSPPSLPPSPTLPLPSPRPANGRGARPSAADSVAAVRRAWPAPSPPAWRPSAIQVRETLLPPGCTLCKRPARSTNCAREVSRARASWRHSIDSVTRRLSGKRRGGTDGSSFYRFIVLSFYRVFYRVGLASNVAHMLSWRATISLHVTRGAAVALFLAHPAIDSHSTRFCRPVCCCFFLRARAEPSAE